MLELYYWKDKI